MCIPAINSGGILMIPGVILGALDKVIAGVVPSEYILDVVGFTVSIKDINCKHIK